MAQILVLTLEISFCILFVRYIITYIYGKKIDPCRDNSAIQKRVYPTCLTCEYFQRYFLIRNLCLGPLFLSRLFCARFRWTFLIVNRYPLAPQNSCVSGQFLLLGFCWSPWGRAGSSPVSWLLALISSRYFSTQWSPAPARKKDHEFCSCWHFASPHPTTFPPANTDVKATSFSSLSLSITAKRE